MRLSVIVPAAALLFASLATPAGADADRYVSAGIGTGAVLGGDLADFFVTDGAKSGRIAVGQRFGMFGLEASMFGSDMTGDSAFTGRGDHSTLSLGVAGKYYHPIILNKFEAFGRLGLNKTWLRAPETVANHNYEGRGIDLGAGVQYNFTLPFAQASVYVDLTHQRTTLREGPKTKLDGSLTMLSLGATVGF